MVRLNTKVNNENHLGGGYLSNPTITKKNKHERILENPSL